MTPCPEALGSPHELVRSGIDTFGCRYCGATEAEIAREVAAS